jgi:AhpD family alkylhydroperoxidase
MSHPHFPPLTLDTAPEASRRLMTATAQRLGHVPDGVARLAAAPQLLGGFLQLSASFDTTSLDPRAREVLIMTMAARNHCHVCLAMHSKILADSGADPDLIAALRAGASLSVPELEAMRVFTLAVLDTAGDVRGAPLTEFLAHGYTPRRALEVVLGIGAYTLSTFANRMTGAQIGPHLAAYA